MAREKGIRCIVVGGRGKYSLVKVKELVCIIIVVVVDAVVNFLAYQ